MRTIQVLDRVRLVGGVEATVRGFAEGDTVAVGYYTADGEYRRSWVNLTAIDAII